jgi:hypothetical protein
MNNALQILLKYPYFKEEYSSILKAMFTIEALAIGGQWSTLGTSSAKDSPRINQPIHQCHHHHHHTHRGGGDPRLWVTTIPISN